MSQEDLQLATLANGCFWCTEAVFQRIEGVERVVSGFTGGDIKNPAYREVVSGRTGHRFLPRFAGSAICIKFCGLSSALFYQYLSNMAASTAFPYYRP